MKKLMVCIMALGLTLHVAMNAMKDEKIVPDAKKEDLVHVPLFAAIDEGNVKKVEEELGKPGVDINYARFVDGATPLAVSIDLKQSDIYRLLLKKGARAHAFMPKKPETSLVDEALARQDIMLCILLLDHDAILTRKNYNTLVDLLYDESLIEGIDLYSIIDKANRNVKVNGVQKS